ncbi:uncharacterized protein (DUF1015 family) [Actinomadura rupiterrae]|nr:uncharacterized protein (DUF1015 family) [Actinomadura rupiterrae]
MERDLPSGPTTTSEEFSARVFGASGPAAGAGLELAPFRGVRFDPSVVGDLATVTTPPYDLIDDAERRRLLSEGGHNFVRLILPGQPGGGYREAGETLRRWLDEGVLSVDADPALYVYEAADGPAVLQRGLVGAVGLRPESQGVILPHEDVYPGPVRDRLALMSEARANLEPIFLIHEGGGDAARIVDEAAAAPPLMEFTAADGLVHRMWRITDPVRVARISADLRGRQALIADGHHRYATYRTLQARYHRSGFGDGPWDHGLALLVDSTRYPPRLGAIHRVLPGLPPRRALERAKGVLDVTSLPDSLPLALEALTDAADRPAFLLGGGDGLHLLTDPDPARLAAVMPPDRSPRWQGLDTAVLDHLLIAGVWGVPENERSVEVVHDDPAAALDRARQAGGTAVILNPMRFEDVLAVAGNGERVPRKSTSFGPKPRMGMIFRLLAPP